MRALAPIVLAGLAGMFVLKLLAALVLPLFGLLLGLAGLALKATLFIALAYVVLRFLRRRKADSLAG